MDVETGFDQKALATQLMPLALKGDLKGFEASAQRMVIEHGDAASNVIASFRALLDVELLAADAKLRSQHRPKMWWMRGPFPGNFGDILTPYVLWHAFGVMPKWAPASKADGICIGSIAKYARPGMRVWGAGMPRAKDPMCPTAIYAALRGPLSRDVVLKSGGTAPEIYGDPAVLLPELYQPKGPKRYKVGIIPHVLQYEKFRSKLETLGRDDVKVISLFAASFADIERVIDDIASCEEIVSTSLHGVIVAHAYGVPCQSAKLGRESGEEIEDSFKMKDYKQSVGLSDAPLVADEGFTDLDWLAARRCVVPPRMVDLAALKDAFPFARRK